jgi:hypothetical protein
MPNSNWSSLPTPAPPDDGHRARRVLILLVGVMTLSLADLLITLTYLQANWMMEANPIAAWIIRNTPSLGVTTAALASFKIGTVGVCVSLLYSLRWSRAGEAAAWVAVGVLTVMAVMWHQYAGHFEETDTVMLAHIWPHRDLLP